MCEQRSLAASGVLLHCHPLPFLAQACSLYISRSLVTTSMQRNAPHPGPGITLPSPSLFSLHDGRAHFRRRRARASSSLRAPLLRLQCLCSSCALLCELAPPWEKGTRWSRCASCQSWIGCRHSAH